MGFIINELSVDGQFQNENDFQENLNDCIKCVKYLKSLNIKTFVSSKFYSAKITPSLTINNILVRSNLDIYTLLKRLLEKSDISFWDCDTKQSNTDMYECEYTTQLNDYSLAEACERRKEVYSFNHVKFKNNELIVQKNKSDITIQNFILAEKLLDYLYQNNFFDHNELLYCKYKFKHNLDFSKINKNSQFNILTDDEKREFINTFKKFNNMSWEDIYRDRGLNYKKYHDNNNHFNQYNTNTEISKFRTSQLCRCFGYRENEKFVVLEFDNTHKLSDCG